MKEWYVLIDDQKMGPYTTEVLVKLADSEQLTSDTYVWNDTLDEWVPAGEVSELAGHGDIRRLRVKASPVPGSPPQPPLQTMSHPESNPLVDGYNQRAMHKTSSGFETVVSLRDWMFTLFLISIPVVGFILLLVWAFDKNTKESKRNWAKASLLWVLVIFAFYLVALMFAIALPGFMSARMQAQENACLNNLRIIESAKDQWAIEEGERTGAFVSENDITPFLNTYSLPECPADGSYHIGRVGDSASCSLHGHLF